MATSQQNTLQWTSDAFVESAGAIPFRLSDQKICLVYLASKKEYLLAKGRRNCGETRHEAAIREVEEETGYKCRLLPVTMQTRAPPTVEEEQLPDVARTYSNITEPFFLQLRHLKSGGAKLIWWYVAAINEHEPPGKTLEANKFEVEFFSFDEALQRLTYEGDRNLLAKAVEILNTSMHE